MIETIVMRHISNAPLLTLKKRLCVEFHLFVFLRGWLKPRRVPQDMAGRSLRESRLARKGRANRTLEPEFDEVGEEGEEDVMEAAPVFNYIFDEVLSVDTGRATN
jgi:hypothetical protein